MSPVQRDSTGWLVCRRPAPNAVARLVCLPYAGGGANVFYGWEAVLGPRFEVWTATLPGREKRLREAATASMASVADPLANAVLRLPGPVALYGHSMGGLIALEVARRLDRAGAPPSWLLVGAAPAPQRSYEGIDPDDASDDDVVRWMRSLGGVSEAVMQDAELLEVVLPVLRQDLRLCARYRYVQEHRLSCPVHAFLGSRDRFTPAGRMLGWADTTTGPYLLEEVDGGHFFLHERRESLLASISATVRRGQGVVADVAATGDRTPAATDSRVRGSGVHQR
jgi:surfactin synthase thioesterase subunit